jgi:hypothetical protein
MLPPVYVCCCSVVGLDVDMLEVVIALAVYFVPVMVDVFDCFVYHLVSMYYVNKTDHFVLVNLFVCPALSLWCYL